MDIYPYGLCPTCKNKNHPFSNPNSELIQYGHIICEKCRAIQELTKPFTGNHLSLECSVCGEIDVHYLRVIKNVYRKDQ